VAGESDIVARARRVRRLLRVRSGEFDLSSVDPAATPGVPRQMPDGQNPKAWSRAEVAVLGRHIAVHQARLHAAAVTRVSRQRVLLLLQAMDCGGKDGTVKSVLGAMDPLGVRITAFGPPTAEELAHHYLWRISRALPQSGYVGVFNRSHYEDVLVVRVRGLVPATMWRGRYEEINAFEQAQAADGMTMVKVMLHISKEEQRRRLLGRLDDPAKRWKFNPDDIDERQRWEAYQEAYSDAINRCGTRSAPWYVVPADRKWYRNWAVANLLLAHLEEIHTGPPEPEYDVAEQRQRLLAEEAEEFEPPREMASEVERRVNS
jgi:PPK2 family polyphosphate:nucleotide phosphotransferase